MTIEHWQIKVSGIDVEVVRKDIKNLHLGVYPPNGQVRVAAPLVLSDEAVRLAVVDKLAWIKRQQSRFVEQPRQSTREMVGGECHYVQGKRLRLRVHERPGCAEVVVRGHEFLDLFVPAGTAPEKRLEILNRWYRGQLRESIPPLLEKWRGVLELPPVDWGIKKMRTRWGTCQIEARRLCFNLELAKKPVACLEYIVVHELLHLLERNHTARFTALMDKHYPRWREVREELNGLPLGPEEWRE